MASSTGSLLKYLGLIGTSGVHTGTLVPRANTPDAEARLLQDFIGAGKVADPEIWNKFNSYMRRPTTLEEMLRLWEEMSMWDLLAAALVEIVDEATQSDSNSPATLWYKCNDQEFEEELNEMFLRIGGEEVLPSQVYHVSALGNNMEKLEYAPQEGIIGMSFVHPMDVRRYWLERNRKCIGFRWRGQKPNKDDVFVMPDNRTPVERVTLSSGQTTEDLFYPWDFLHQRRMYRMRMSEHGEPIFAEADGIYKKMRLAIDQMVVHRAQIQPQRYAINIDVQEQPPLEQMKTVHRWRQQLRSKVSFGAGNSPDLLSGPTDFMSFYNAWALDTVIYLAQPKGFQNTITNLPGTQQIPDVYDIELLTDLFYSIIGMPRSWFSAKADQGETPASGKALLAQDMRFLRKIKGIRRPIIQSYEWLAYFHAVLKGKDPEQLEIKAQMPPIGGLEEQMKMELLQKQAELLGQLGDVMDQYKLPKEAWIETIFKRYMHLPDEVVNTFITALPGEAPTDDQQESRKAAPSTLRMIYEIENQVKGDVRAWNMVQRLKETVYGYPHPEAPVRRGRKLHEILTRPEFRKDRPDFVISSYGRHPAQMAPSERTNGHTRPIMDNETYEKVGLNESLQENRQPAEPAYRKWI